MMIRFLLAAALVPVVGCGLVNDPYVVKNYAVGDTLDATIGSPLVDYEEGTKGALGEVKSKFEKQFIYGGLAGGTIKMVYREFRNDLARPAFSQDLQYDLNQSQVIAFQNLRLKVLSATNEKIVVQVLPEPGGAAAPSSDGKQR